MILSMREIDPRLLPKIRDFNLVDSMKRIACQMAQRDWEKNNFSRMITPSEVGIIPFQPIEQANGFVVGGDNLTSIIRGLITLARRQSKN